MKSLILALLAGVAPPQQIPFDAAIVTPTVAFVQYGPVVATMPTLPALADDPTVFTIEWPCQGCKITVVVPKKDNEDTGNWKRRIKATVDAAKELFPPDPT